MKKDPLANSKNIERILINYLIIIIHIYEFHLENESNIRIQSW